MNYFTVFISCFGNQKYPLFFIQGLISQIMEAWETIL